MVISNTLHLYQQNETKTFLKALIMNNSFLFKKAHQLAKKFKGDYKACFKLALIEVRKMIKKSLLLKKIESYLTKKANEGKNIDNCAIYSSTFMRYNSILEKDRSIFFITLFHSKALQTMFNNL